MSFKIDISEIIRAHRRSIVNFNDEDQSSSTGSDKLSFIVFPLLGASILLWLGVLIDNDYVNIIVSMLSIFVGLLLNMIVVLFDIIRGKQERMIKVELLEEVLANISFTIILSIFTIGVVLLTQVKATCQPWAGVTKAVVYIANFVAYVGLFLFLTTLMMVVNRMYTLFMDEITTAKKSLNKEQSSQEVDPLAED